jgi:alkylation response protein AidB-like acyl-CoA dehydrogenase
MSATYSYGTRELKFVLKEWLPMEQIFAYDRYNGYYTKDDIDIMVDQVHKISRDMIAPTNDDTPVRLEDGKVYVNPAFKKLFKYLQENGWGTGNIDHNEEGTLPLTVLCALGEMMGAANPSFMPYIGLTTGAAGLVQSFADEDLKQMFLPKMFDGNWSGTMCLTEPSAGSDVGDVLSRAYPTDDPRIYKIKGSKIFITGGDGDHVENVIHLYLARIEGGKLGTKGISLFIVPKYWVNPDGSLEPNDVETTAVEHKLGLKGSTTAALATGDNNNCRGWLLGKFDKETSEGEGMAQMFQMMNEERHVTGMAAYSITSNAYWNAAAYCKERIQGRLLTNPKGERTQIINHEDVKRMLLLNKSTLEACRAICLKTAFLMDVMENEPDPEIKRVAQGKWECLTPVAKAYPSDEAWPLVGECMQAMGGYGYCEEYPVAQSARDVKIYSIWEGTNFIQAMDLVGRKWTMGKGAIFASLLKEVQDFIKANKGAEGFEKEFANLEKALASYRQIQMTIGGFYGAKQFGLMPTYARRILTATGQLLGGYYLLEQGLIAKKRMEELGAEHYDYNFYYGKLLSCRYYLRNVVPNVWHLLEIISAGDTSCMDAPIEIFQY